jgi:hypothetical protein
MTIQQEFAINGLAFTGEGKLVRKATGDEQKKLKPRYPTSGSRAARAELQAPLERIGDPQISPTRLKKRRLSI